MSDMIYIVRYACPDEKPIGIVETGGLLRRFPSE